MRGLMSQHAIEGGLHDSEKPIMRAITAIGLDIAKSVFQVHGVECGWIVLLFRGEGTVKRATKP
jgi:hypothetical protein